MALMNAGIVNVVKLDRDYQFVQKGSEDAFELTYKDHEGTVKRDTYRYVVNARGQSKSVETDPSLLMRSMLKRGIVQTEEIRTVQQMNRQGLKNATPTQTAWQTYKTGGIWIDPDTHHPMRQSPDRVTSRLDTVYAVGAMTRGQIINSSTAHGIVQTTAAIANDLFDELKNIMI